MVKTKPCHLRDPLRLNLGSLHDDTLIVKIHVSSEILHITGKRFLIHRDADGVVWLHHDIHRLHKRNALYPLVFVFQRQIEGVVAQISCHDHRLDLLGRIVFITVNLDCFDCKVCQHKICGYQQHIDDPQHDDHPYLNPYIRHFYYDIVLFAHDFFLINVTDQST